MHTKQFIAALVAATVTAGASMAATITENFSFLGGANGSFTSMNFVGDQGTNVTVTAGTYPTFSYNYSQDGDERVAHGATWGLGAYSDGSDNDHRVDGSGENDILIFTFDRNVTANSITFGNWYPGSDFDMYGSDQPGTEDCCNEIVSSVTDVTFTGKSGNILGVGAWAGGAGFKIRGMSVTYEMSAIPLPAAGWMLLAGVGGLAAVRRKRKG